MPQLKRRVCESHKVQTEPTVAYRKKIVTCHILSITLFFIQTCESLVYFFFFFFFETMFPITLESSIFSIVQPNSSISRSRRTSRCRGHSSGVLQASFKNACSTFAFRRNKRGAKNDVTLRCKGCLSFCGFSHSSRRSID